MIANQSFFILDNYLPYSQKYTGSTILSVAGKTHYYSFSRKGGWCILSILDTKWWNFLFKYSACNKTIPFTCRIDPYEGNPRRSLTWGSTINHSLNHANVKPFIAEKNSDNPRVFLVALHDIAQTTELLWNYNDDQCHFYSNSQTLPKEH